MTINTIVLFVLVQAETAPEWRSLHIEISHAKTHTNISDSVCKDLYSTQRTYHITIIIYLTQLNAGPEFILETFLFRKCLH